MDMHWQSFKGWGEKFRLMQGQQETIEKFWAVESCDQIFKEIPMATVWKTFQICISWQKFFLKKSIRHLYSKIFLISQTQEKLNICLSEMTSKMPYSTEAI